MNITTGKRKRAQKVVVYGTEGIGKTTFASHFPSPVFIDTESSTDHLDVARTDKPTSWQMLISFVKAYEGPSRIYDARYRYYRLGRTVMR